MRFFKKIEKHKVSFTFTHYRNSLILPSLCCTTVVSCLFITSLIFFAQTQQVNKKSYFRFGLFVRAAKIKRMFTSGCQWRPGCNVKKQTCCSSVVHMCEYFSFQLDKGVFEESGNVFKSAVG